MSARDAISNALDRIRDSNMLHSEKIDAILSAFTAAGWVMERDWQPIETAPRDGAWIMHYDASSPLSDGYLIDYYDPDTGGWNGTPTHWRPLPTPPQQEANDDGR